MLKALALVRSAFLVFIIGFRFYAAPVYVTMPRTLDEQYARCSASQESLRTVIMVAIAWIALETLLGWIMARGKSAPAQPPATAQK